MSHILFEYVHLVFYKKQKFLKFSWFLAYKATKLQEYLQVEVS